jgi:LuxR family quorum sensing-dependent transcriptional regulator
MPAVCLIAVYAFEHLRKFASRLPPLAKSALTARERDVLAWAAHGKSAWEIGEILGIAKRTVDEHTQTAMRKLGAVNKTQAVAIAMRDRYIAL